MRLLISGNFRSYVNPYNYFLKNEQTNKSLPVVCLRQPLYYDMHQRELPKASIHLLAWAKQQDGVCSLPREMRKDGLERIG